MQNKWVLIIIPIVGAVASFALTPVFWPTPAGMAMPSSAQMPLLIGISVIESIAFGIGLAFLYSLWPFVRGRGTGDWLVYLSAAWLLISWWPHDNFHRVMAMNDFSQLIRIEWGFHFTLIVAGVLVASFVWKQFAASRPE
ncbi:MAG: hypothetical protein JO019_03865 [Candidatus Kaiserbacteria bacterium]|nr:hypothetical protein [Candidatus Kaiserbacteria bacterium]